MRSTLLSHSEWAKRTTSGLERRPRQNGAGVTPQWDRAGDHYKGKTSCKKVNNLDSSCHRPTQETVKHITPLKTVMCRPVYRLNK